MRPRSLMVLALAFAVAHTQAPLYFSNQNQYFLHGLAESGIGDLERDWLANTTDPTPLFSAFVRIAPNEVIHATFFLILISYFLSLMLIAAKLPFVQRPFLLAMLLIVLHSGLLRAVSVHIFGLDIPWYFQCGVANQYLLGPGLQPSCSGVLLLAAIMAVLYDRFIFAAILIAAACTIHSTYLLSAAFLSIATMAALGRSAAMIRFAALALILTLPVVIHQAITFAPNQDPPAYQAAMELLAWVRIPHHTDPRRWFDAIAGLQLLLIAASVVLVRKEQRLFIIATVSFLLAILAANFAFFTHSSLLTLLFPWRVSTVLMPIATTVMLAWLCGFPRRDPKPNCQPLLASIAVLVLSILAAIAVDGLHLGYRESSAEAALITRVKTLCKPGEVYLLPAGFPTVSTSRGSYSSTFMPAGSTVNPFELQRFRLGTGACVYVDFKSIPYRDDEVLEWQRRLRNCERWYRNLADDATLNEIAREGMTHIVSIEPLTSPRLREVADTGAYRVYALQRD